MAIILIISLLVVGYFLRLVTQIVYNLYFHPLAKFPAPWWAAATDWSEAYFDLVQGGQYYKKIEAMHEKYGPIVRVTPDELSICDSQFYEHIYGRMGDRRDIDIKFAQTSGVPTSVVSTLKHDHHRIRRAPLNGFFSKQAINKLEGSIWSKVSLLIEKLKHAHKSGTVFPIIDAFGALTTDVITEYSYGESFKFLGDSSNFELQNSFAHSISSLVFFTPVMTHFPLMAKIITCIPDWITELSNPHIARMNGLRRFCAQMGQKAIDRNQSGSQEKERTIFSALLSPQMPPEERTLQRMTDESFTIIGAGLETTSRFLTNITCHLLLDREILSKLQTELKAAMPSPNDQPSWSALEKLPYLSAVVQEGLRCETFMIARFPRTILEPMPYGEYVIPAGTSIGCSPYLQNNSPDVFPEPERFRPERWIEARERGENLTKYLGTFAKGGRMCIGINLAYAELYLATAAVFRNFDMELVDSGLEDILSDRGFLFGFTKNWDFGVKVKIITALD